MPIGQSGPKSTGSKLLFPMDPNSNLTVLSKGTAISALVSGTTLICSPCSCTANPENFYGFVQYDTVAGNLARIIIERGAILTPLVEGNLTLIPTQPVFLSNTPGYVTQVNLTDLQYLYPVGFAVNETQIAFITDYKVDFPQ